MFVNFEVGPVKKRIKLKGLRAHISATTASSDRMRPLLPPDRRCPQSSTALCCRPPQFFVSPTVHAAMAMCAAPLLLPTRRPVLFSPPRYAILFPSPSRLCIARSSPAAPLLLVRDVKDRRAGHRSSSPRISSFTFLSGAVASSCWPASRPHQTSPKQSRHHPPDRESTAPSAPHLRSSPGPVDRATSFASSPCCSPTTPAPTSAAPPAPHRRSSPLDVRRREAAVVVSHSPPRCLQSVHLDAGVLRGHFPHCLVPPARWISATDRKVAAMACARRHARARAGSTVGLGHQAGSAY
jgi:hypothetical protein